MADPSGLLIYKPCTPAEIAFYESTLAEHPEFADLMPTFMGTLQRGRSQQLQDVLSGQNAGQEDITSMILPTPDLVEGQGSGDGGGAAPLRGRMLETEFVLVLENVLTGFKRPNIMDVKLGRRLWGDDAPPAKRARLDDVAAKTTSSTLGYRVAGMQIWEPLKTGDGGDMSGAGSNEAPIHALANERDGRYKAYDKTYGRSLTKDNVRDAFNKLFCLGDGGSSGEYSEEIIRDIDRSIEEIGTVLANKESRMYSASLLIVYEGDPAARQEIIDAARTRAIAEAKAGVQDAEKDNEEKDEDEDEDVDDEEEDDVDEEQEPKLFDVRVIDFAHSAWTPGQGPDENLLFGLRNVRRTIKGLLEE